MSTLATDSRAKFDYDTLKTYEDGLVLTGQGVKSVQARNLLDLTRKDRGW